VGPWKTQNCENPPQIKSKLANSSEVFYLSYIYRDYFIVLQVVPCLKPLIAFDVSRENLFDTETLISETAERCPVKSIQETCS